MLTEGVEINNQLDLQINCLKKIKDIFVNLQTLQYIYFEELDNLNFKSNT